MNTMPKHLDLSDNPKQGTLPFYIGIHDIVHTPPHYHEHVEFSLIIEGSGNETANGITYELKPGTASFMLPNHIHSIRCHAQQPVRKFCCMFDLSILLDQYADREWCDLVYKIGSEYSSSTTFQADDRQWIHSMFRRLLVESTRAKPQPGKNTMIRAILIETLLLFIRNVKTNLSETNDIKADEPSFWPILQYIHVNYADRITLNDVADAFCVSASYLSRMMKRHMGQNFLQYIHQLRIQSAATLLLNTNLSIMDIAVETGFDSVRTFNRVFNQTKQLSPSEYRKKMKQASSNIQTFKPQ